jgi:hypothetical protein
MFAKIFAAQIFFFSFRENMCKTEANAFGSFPLLNFDYFCLTFRGNKGFNDFRQNVKFAETK